MIPFIVTATFEIVTPMFLGGADHAATRIRETSIKGALAFWWRALNYARFVGDADQDQDVALKAMQKKEQELFGGPSGQGAFLMLVKQPKNIKFHKKMETLKETQNNTVGVGARYLGYGLMGAFGQNKGKLERSCIKAGQNFSVQIMFNASNQDLIEKQIIPALKLFGLLGGLGSRVRRGWGSVALTSLTADEIKGFAKWTAPTSTNDYKKKIQELFEGHASTSKTAQGTDWPLTAFAKETIIRVGTTTDNNALTVLDELGIGFMKYRTWGKPEGKAGGRLDGKTGKYIGGFDVDASFGADHDWFRNSSGKPDTPPQRTAFGLPHNYAKWLGVTAANITRDGKEIIFERRASPLMFHIHKMPETESFGVALYFPCKFLEGRKVGIVRGTGRDQIKTPTCYTFDASIIGQFLNNKKPDGSTPPDGDYFSSEQILPLEGRP